MTKDFSLHSGERLAALDIPVIYPDHLARYQYVCDDMQGRTGPLYGADVFCGAGYGANLLAEQLNATVLGIDGSVEAIARAQVEYNKSNLLFSAKIFPFALPYSTFDFIASMESVEHVLDHLAFCRVLCAALKPRGRLYISAPNEERLELSKLNYHWHYKHFRPGELSDLLRPFGMREVATFSTSMNVESEGRFLAFYPYQPTGHELLPPDGGDTLFSVFEKVAA